MPVTPGGGSGSPPVNILIGQPGRAPAQDVTTLIDLSTIRIEETGNQEGATLDAQLLDRSQLFASMRAEWRIVTNWKNPVSGAWQAMFNGFIREPSPEVAAIYGVLGIHAEDVGTLLDTFVLQDRQVRTSSSDTNDKARIGWLFGSLKGRDGVVIAQPLVDSSVGLNYTSKVQVLNSSMPRQEFPARLSGRQALERILSQASDSADYFIDAEPRLWTFDSDTAASVLDTAPYEIDATPLPAAGKVAPEDLVVEWDSSNLWTGFYVRGANAKVSKAYWDSDPFPQTSAGPLPPPYGVDLWGRRMGFLSAPDADTDAKVQRVVRAALRDTRNPVPRISFSVSEASAYDAAGKRWRGGQLVRVTSAIHGLNAATDTTTNASSRVWAGQGGTGAALLQPFRIKRVVTTFLSGTGKMRQEIEAGGRRKVLYEGSGA